MKKIILSSLIMTALILGAAGSVFATRTHMNNFNSTYGTSSTVLNTCTLCHPSGTSTHNAYSTAFRNAGHNFRTIENSDSDGDGYNNMVEINARTFPGDSASHPTTGDTAVPSVTNFVIPSNSTSLTVPITTFTATDNVGVTGYMVNESSTKPSALATGWSTSAPTSYACSSAGAKTLYAWAKDEAGNVSASRSASVSVTTTLPPPPSPSQAGIIFTAGKYGEYYADPARWVNAGYRVGIWGNNVTVKAQAIDSNGKKIAGTFSYRITSTNQYGVLNLIDAQNLAYQKALTLPLGQNYAYTVTSNGTTANGTIYSIAAKCDACHRTPEGHIADQSTWGSCRSCHNLSNVTHKHIYKFGATFQCYACHTSDSSNGDIHLTLTNPSGYPGFTCVNCHGDLSMTQNNTFKTSSMAGLPKCADCHDRNHSEPVAGVSFSNSVGHGGLFCISCHSSPHRVQRLMNRGTSSTNNCSGCHPNATHSGASCGDCHGSSWDPHLVSAPSPSSTSSPSPTPTPPSGDDDHEPGDD